MCDLGTVCLLFGELRSGAGIPAGMVRMSVGLTGSLEQRIGQLMESFTAVCGHRQLPYRAAEARSAPLGTCTGLPTVALSSSF